METAGEGVKGSNMFYKHRRIGTTTGDSVIGLLVPYQTGKTIVPTNGEDQQRILSFARAKGFIIFFIAVEVV